MFRISKCNFPNMLLRKMYQFSREIECSIMFIFLIRHLNWPLLTLSTDMACTVKKIIIFFLIFCKLYRRKIHLKLLFCKLFWIEVQFFYFVYLQCPEEILSSSPLLHPEESSPATQTGCPGIQLACTAIDSLPRY